jgi:ribosome-binding protein aMBF1 (putative translation factor)
VKNLDIRMLVSDHGLKYKDLADEMNITPEWLSRLLRYNLTPENKIRIMGAIERLTKGAETDDIQ